MFRVRSERLRNQWRCISMRAIWLDHEGRGSPEGRLHGTCSAQRAKTAGAVAATDTPFWVCYGRFVFRRVVDASDNAPLKRLLQHKKIIEACILTQCVN